MGLTRGNRSPELQVFPDRMGGDCPEVPPPPPSLKPGRLHADSRRKCGGQTRSSQVETLPATLTAPEGDRAAFVERQLPVTGEL